MNSGSCHGWPCRLADWVSPLAVLHPFQKNFPVFKHLGNVSQKVLETQSQLRLSP
jgi:hypothetical protein